MKLFDSVFKTKDGMNTFVRQLMKWNLPEYEDYELDKIVISITDDYIESSKPDMDKENLAAEFIGFELTDEAKEKTDNEEIQNLQGHLLISIPALENVLGNDFYLPNIPELDYNLTFEDNYKSHLAFIITHECRHIEQYFYAKETTDSRHTHCYYLIGQMSDYDDNPLEIDANRYALSKLFDMKEIPKYNKSVEELFEEIYDIIESACKDFSIKLF